jgi:hypothetical protein
MGVIRRRFNTVGLTLLLLASLTGCSFLAAPDPIPSGSEIVGKWVHPGPGAHKATITFDESGIFKATGVPAQVFSYVGGPDFSSTIDWTTATSFNGTWAISSERDGSLPYIVFDIAQRDGSGGLATRLYSRGDGRGRQLYTSVGPIDDGVEFAFSRTRS